MPAQLPVVWGSAARAPANAGKAGVSGRRADPLKPFPPPRAPLRATERSIGTAALSGRPPDGRRRGRAGAGPSPPPPPPRRQGRWSVAGRRRGVAVRSLAAAAPALAARGGAARASVVETPLATARVGQRRRSPLPPPSLQGGLCGGGSGVGRGGGRRGGGGGGGGSGGRHCWGRDSGGPRPEQGGGDGGRPPTAPRPCHGLGRYQLRGGQV